MTELHKLECVAWQYIRWDLLIADMEAGGHRNSAVARAINVPPQTLDDWKRGAEPRYSRGEALLLLHSRIFGRDFTANRIKDFRQAALMQAEQPANAQGANHACSATQSRLRTW